MCDRRLVAFLVALWVTPTVSQAGLITDPAANEILLHLGEPSVDPSSGFADFQITLRFGDDWLGQSLSFVGINVERTWVNGNQLESDSTLFSRFLFLPTPGSDIETWGVTGQPFGGGSTPGLEERFGVPFIDSLPEVSGEMPIGTLRFDSDLAESTGTGGALVPGGLNRVPGGPNRLTRIDFLEVGLGGGVSSSTDSAGTTTVIGLLDDGDFRFIEPRLIPDSRIANFEPGTDNHVVPEPSGGVIIAVAIGCVLAVNRRHQLRRVQ